MFVVDPAEQKDPQVGRMAETDEWPPSERHNIRGCMHL